MKLYIDTSDSEKVTISLDGEKYTEKSRENKAQKLLPFLDEILRKKGKELKDIDSIEVNTGPGSYTGLRVGVAVANALGWALGVPVNGKNLREGEKVDIKYE